MNKTEQTQKYGLRQLFNLREDRARGRTCMLSSNILVSMITNLSTGLFYTSFLTANGINIVEIGILSFVPFIANCFSIFSPGILERFKKRRFILAASRLLYYTLNLLAVTVMPYFVSDPTLKMNLFIAIVFAANIVNALFSGGYSVWHISFIPDDVRAEYLSVNSLTTATLGCATSLAASLTADLLRGSRYELTIIIILRFAAYLLAILDVVILSSPKEYPYERSGDRVRFSDIFVKPFQNRKFALTMLIAFAYTFFAHVPTSSLDYFLLNSVGVKYTLISVVNMFWPLFLLIFLPFWKRILYRIGWFRTFAFGEFLHFPTTLLYSFISPENYMWLLPTVRLTQHFIGVGRNLAYSNFLYINLPDTDRTNYVSFHTLSTNAAAFLGMMAGTSFVAAFPDLKINLFGFTFMNVPVLLWILALGEILVPLLLTKLLPVLDRHAPKR